MKSSIWHLSDIGYFVSIGAGVPSPARIYTPIDSTSLLGIAGLENLQRAQELLRATFKSSTDCERTQEEVSGMQGFKTSKYFRFNLESGLEDVGRYEASKVATKWPLYAREQTGIFRNQRSEIHCLSVLFISLRGTRSNCYRL